MRLPSATFRIHSSRTSRAAIVVEVHPPPNYRDKIRAAISKSANWLRQILAYSPPLAWSATARVLPHGFTFLPQTPVRGAKPRSYGQPVAAGPRRSV